jgi:hypothetical protein
MKNRKHNLAVSDLLVLAAILTLILAAWANVGAQDRPISAQLAAGGVAAPERDWGPPFEILGRALLSETDGHEEDWRPMLAVYAARAARVNSTPEKVALRYASIYRVRPRPLSPTEARELAAALVLVHNKPGLLPERERGFYNRQRQLELQAIPHSMPPARTDQWTRASDLAQRWLAGDTEHGCSATPTHFGDRRRDHARAVRRGWREVHCPGALSWFGRE